MIQTFPEVPLLLLCQVPDLKALMGDSSDNIPGLRGIGPKTASQLLQMHGDLDALFKEESLAQLKPGVAGKLKGGQEQAALYKSLATVRCVGMYALRACKQGCVCVCASCLLPAVSPGLCLQANTVSRGTLAAAGLGIARSWQAGGQSMHPGWQAEFAEAGT